MKERFLKSGCAALLMLSLAFLPACEKIAAKAGFRDSNYFAYHPYNETFLEEAVSRERLYILAEALEAYYLTFGEYPEELKALYENGFISQKELSHPWQKPYSYHRLSLQKERTALGRLPEAAWELALAP